MATAYGAKTTYIDGIGMVQHINNIGSNWELNLVAYYLAPDSDSGE